MSSPDSEGKAPKSREPATPAPNPYPEPGSRVTGFRYVDSLHLRRDLRAVWPEPKWIVSKDYACEVDIDGKSQKVVVPEGTETNFASVPQFLQSFVSTVGRHAEAAVIHDYLYTAWRELDVGPRREDRFFADSVFWFAMRAACVGRFKSGVIYSAVRLGGRRPYSRTAKGYLRYRQHLAGSRSYVTRVASSVIAIVAALAAAWSAVDRLLRLIGL